MLTLTKAHMRWLILSSLLFTIVGAAFELIWPSPILEQVADFAYQLEPEVEGIGQTILFATLMVALVLCIASFVGLLLFKNWSRLLFLACFVLFLPVYPFIGITVSSGTSQIFYDLSMMTSGAVLALIYCSPVADYYRKDE